MFDPLVCPRCHGALERRNGGSSCSACAIDYPTIGTLRCLVEDPPLFRGVWKSHLDGYLASTAERLSALQSAAVLPHLLERTRRRIRHAHDAVVADCTSLIDLFRDFVPKAQGSVPSVLPPPDPRTPDTSIIKFSEHLFRDWVWGQRESESALDIVRRLAQEPLGNAAVYGVGTGRLAFDIRRELDSESVLGFDVNPLPLLVTARLFAGEEVELHEYPLAPNSAEDSAYRHRFERPFDMPDKVELVFADALRPPLRPGSLDAIVTPWFIDSVAADVRETAASINRALRPGGAWLNFGPLRFEGAAARLYVIDEVHEVVAASGFEIRSQFSENVPYFHSPHSGTHRSDRIFAFNARKVAESEPLPAPPLFAPWLSDTTLPIPVSQAFAGLQNHSVLTVGILTMIDGRRSLRDIAGELSGQWGVPPQVLEDQLRPFIARLPFS
jgi:hypothetical protein